MRRHRLSPSRIWARGRRDPATGCLVWQGAHDAKGYGRVRYRGRVVRPHRLAWELSRHRRVPAGKLVTHRCDNPPCFEPRHMRLGTPQSNMREASLRGRLCHGERHPRAKLTGSVVAEARSVHQAGLATFAVLAAESGVAPATIREAVVGVTWRHVQ
jgi:hypothetical protein